MSKGKYSGIWYIGLSADPNKRLIQHNQGKSKFTKGHRLWKLIYFEKIGDLKDTRRLEKYYKTSAGKKRLHKILESRGR